MPYTLSARQLFEVLLPQQLPSSEALKAVGGIVEVALEGEWAGTWTVDLDAARVTAGSATAPELLVRAQAQDFLALVEGRMTLKDGLLTERLSITGDAARLTRFFAALAQLQQGG